MIEIERLRDNIRSVVEQIEEAASRSSRRKEDILLLAVTKAVPPEMIEMAIDEGLRFFGENRVQEAADKIPRVSPGVVWHMVGHLQTNKARSAVRLFEMIHSVDSIKLGRVVDRHAREIGKIQKCLVEVNLSGEPSKYGMNAKELKHFLEAASALTGISIQGLMTIPPYDPDPERSRRYFIKLRELANEASGWNIPHISMKELSMGMTEDFPVAIEEGSTIIRIGRAIFARMPLET
ncbi:MAG: YggS family pyridoxal phosphate-dependent enzyme [Acidobacteriota bacterium]